MVIDVEPAKAESMYAGTALRGKCPRCGGKNLVFLELIETNNVAVRCSDCGHSELHTRKDLFEVRHLMR